MPGCIIGGSLKQQFKLKIGGRVSFIFSDEEDEPRTIAAHVVGFLEGKNERFSWRIQGTGKKSGDLKTPQYFLKNTGVEELNGSVMLGFDVKNWKMEVFYSHFYSKIGIFKGSHISAKGIEEFCVGGNASSFYNYIFIINRKSFGYPKHFFLKGNLSLKRKGENLFKIGFTACTQLLF